MARANPASRISARRPRTVWIAAVACVVGVAAIITWAVWPESQDAPRSRQYSEYTACLLTDTQGPQGPDAAPIWRGMQSASLKTHAQAQFQQVSDPLTLDNARSTLAGMTQGRCNLVFAAGDKPVAAIREDAKKYPSVHFYLLGGGADATNLTHLPSSIDKISTAVADTIIKAAGQA
ncbi:hypothetical protein [Dactylosporangium sp. CS-033363]|uniref:hypothetical protein n=1 Tax=Dactylosporangium sp. CS-033363 TaxID=3239935 RepID=UPI003D8AA2BE